ncbi:MAG TPA: hypothetical protein DCZ69_00730 [Syntrophobacteraceae bacterium]|nr:hypothetical protein [Syntrophobacteraceae bacterium]
MLFLQLVEEVGQTAHLRRREMVLLAEVQVIAQPLKVESIRAAGDRPLLEMHDEFRLNRGRDGSHAHFSLISKFFQSACFTEI